MSKYAIIQNNIVVNIALSSKPLDSNWILIDDNLLVNIGDIYDGDIFIPAPVDLEVVKTDNKTLRNELLSKTDWTQLPDVSLTADCKAAFALYRNTLRKIDLLNPIWPDMPVEEWVAD